MQCKTRDPRKYLRLPLNLHYAALRYAALRCATLRCASTLRYGASKQISRDIQTRRNHVERIIVVGSCKRPSSDFRLRFIQRPSRWMKQW
jgi:hypothetical protein